MKETSFTWGYHGSADGRYLVKIVASDRLSNPADPAMSRDHRSDPHLEHAVEARLQGDPQRMRLAASLAGTATAGGPWQASITASCGGMGVG